METAGEPDLSVTRFDQKTNIFPNPRGPGLTLFVLLASSLNYMNYIIYMIYNELNGNKHRDRDDEQNKK